MMLTNYNPLETSAFHLNTFLNSQKINTMGVTYCGLG